jgi:heme-degrading monooxygenase HmoA
MQTVLIDKFMVPEVSRAEFLETSRRIQEVLKTLPGFVEGFVYEKGDGASPGDVVTIAVWQSEGAYDKAKKAMAVKLQELGLNPPEIMRRLNVQIERGVYNRSPY